MQRSPLTSRDRAGAIGAVVLIHAAILLAVLNAGGVGVGQREQERPIDTFDVIEPVSPPPVAEEPVDERQEREEGEASPPNLESRATPVVVPPPRVELPRPTPVVASETPAEGVQPTQGAAPVRGPGTGAGGLGAGTGSGGSGTGTGGGGRAAEAPRRASLIQTSALTARDYPAAVLRAWPRRGVVFTAVRVQLDGRATDCRINRSSGSPVVDQWTCRLIEERVRFRPAIDDKGQPYVDWSGYAQEPF